MLSLLALTLDFLLVNASTSQEPFIAELTSVQSIPWDTTLVINNALPQSDAEWCCAFCCPGNASSETAVSNAMTLTNDSMKVEFVETVLKSLGWETAFVVFDDEHGELVFVFSFVFQCVFIVWFV